PRFVDPGGTQRGRGVAFALEADPGAVGYHVQIARDRDFVDVVASARAADPKVDFGPLTAGRYFVRAMAVAPSGLEGLPQVESFVRQVQALDAQPGLGTARNVQLSWSLGGDADARYRLQLFDLARPDLPVIDELSLTGEALGVQNLAAGRYEWRVGQIRAHDGKIDVDWTPRESFTVAE
ncbi:MAG: hypothetical protein RLZZ58_472, partial [Pseudomonadota bacterium]